MLGDLAINHVIPVGHTLSVVALDNVFKRSNHFFIGKVDGHCRAGYGGLSRIFQEHIAVIREEVRQMVDARKTANRIDSGTRKAVAYHDNVLPTWLKSAINSIDKLELHVDDEMRPLPKYRELLFIR